MKTDTLHSWDVIAELAGRLQEQLGRRVIARDEFGPVRLVAGIDAAYAPGDSLAIAAVAVLSFPELGIREESVVRRPIAFPYRPGLLSLREIPASREALDQLRCRPDLLLCDGHGLAHPRRFGLACHIGVLTGIPSIGVAKTILVGSHDEVPRERGAWVPLVDAGEVVGAVVRTRAGVKPIYVSVGHKISLRTAIEFVLRCAHYRLPEPARRAHHLAQAKSRSINYEDRAPGGIESE